MEFQEYHIQNYGGLNTLNEIREVTSNSTYEIFEFDEIDIAEIKKYPVKLLYQQKNMEHANIIIFKNADKLLKFFKMRTGIAHGIKDKSSKMSTVRLYE